MSLTRFGCVVGSAVLLVWSLSEKQVKAQSAAEEGAAAETVSESDEAPGDSPADREPDAEADDGGGPAFESVGEYLLDTPRLFDDPGGFRSSLEDRGLTLSLYYNHFYGVNARGGLNTSNAQRHSGSADLFVDLNFEKLELITGGKAFMQVKSNYNRNVNPDVGAISDPIDDADFDETIYVDQLYYEQSLLDRLVEVRLGYLDYQTIVDRNAYANSEDTQFMTTFLDNNNGIIPLKIGLGAAVWVNPTEWLQLILGTSDADNQILLTGFDTAFDDFESLMGYFEATFKLELEGPQGPLPGNYRAGLFFDPRENAIIGRDDPVTGEPQLSDGHLGVYVSFDQLVFRENSDDLQGAGLFLRYGYKDETVNRLAHVWSGGVQYLGLIPGRDTDAVGLGVYQAFASERFRDKEDGDFHYETGVELYYRVQLTRWFALTPDVQFIDNPGGRKSARDSVVLVLRGRVTF